MNKRKRLNQIRFRRKRRVRTKIKGTALRPRLSIFRSHSHIYAQLIDDIGGRVLAAASSLTVKSKDKKTDKSKNIGLEIAKRAASLGIKKAIFDRGQYQYHGRIAALAEGAREGGLKI
jgi:large subunit ribosomal protein L18